MMNTIFKYILASIFVAFALNACMAKIDKNSIYGEYSLVVDGVDHILIISRDGTYTQKTKIDGEIITINTRVWVDYFPEDDEIRYDLVNFQFPSETISSDWPALFEIIWGRLSLCYYNETMHTECYVKRKPSS